ncbi:glycosyltransferase family 2 protein [Candidatus Neomarinimicrobiota bacterium]
MLKKSISIVIPIYNEKESLPELVSQITTALSNILNWEVVFIDDGSIDGSSNELVRLAENDEKIKLIQFHRNFGKSAAMSEGFKLASGDYIITLDADLQDDPAEIPNLVNKLEEGFDLVSGWKKERKDPLNKKIPSRIFNFVTSLLTGVRIHDFNCGIKIYKSVVAKSLDIYGGRHRYIPALAGQKRFKITEIPVNHRPRMFGVTKYGGSRYFHGFFDLISILFLRKYTQQPLHLFGGIGLIGVLLGLCIDLYVLYLKYVVGEPFQKHLALLLLGVFVIVVGFQFFSLGLIGELIARSQHKHEERIKQIIS